MGGAHFASRGMIKSMDRRRAERLPTVLALMLANALLSGCAALDILDGQIPGEEEAAELPEPRPYPGPGYSRNEAATQTTTDNGAKAAAVTSRPNAPAPVVAKESTTPAPPASPAAVQASVSDEPARAVQKPAVPVSPPAAAPPPKKEEASAPAAPQPASAPPAAEAKTASAETALAGSPPAAKTDQAKSEAPSGDKPEPTADERRAELIRQRDALVAAVEAEIELRQTKDERDPELSQMQQQLRLLYLISERPDDAVEEIESLPPSEQEAFKQVLFGLSTWLAADEEHRPALRNARILRSLRDAAVELSAAAKLDVRNVRLCESVEGFGWYQEFPTSQFRAKQQLILYAEVENFATEKQGPSTFETELAASYQIFDASGTLVDERELPLDKEVCHNQRRDYFLAYRIYLPEGLAEGRYRLELTIEDLKAKDHHQGRKLGDGVVEFSVR